VTDIVMLDRSFSRDPHAVLHQLQGQAPVCRALIWGDVPVWMVTCYDDAKSVLTDPRLSTDRAIALKVLPPNNNGRYGSKLSQHLLHSGPPDHTRLRKLVVKVFTAGAVARLTPRIEEIADELLDAIDTSAPVDLIKEYAGPLPGRVIGELLGVPVEFRDQFLTLLDPYLNQSTGPEMVAASAGLITMLTELFAEKRRQPCDDLISALIEASNDGDRLSETELLATAYLLVAAGYDTTVNLIGNGVAALLRNPSQLAALRADISLLPGAVEELLRIDPPANITVFRFSTAPIRIGEVDIPENQIVVISLLAANHDPDRFQDPDRLDISRTPANHLAFGHGIHHCLGAPLARLEGRIALARLLARFTRLELATTEPLEYRHSLMMRGLSALPVWCQRGSSVPAAD
jgi:cytochrome P450